LRPRRRTFRRLAAISALVLAGIFGFIFVAGLANRFFPRSQERGDITATVVRTTVPIVITCGGELESAQGVQALCEVELKEGVKIVEMVPEGMEVKEGDVIVRLDPSALKDDLASQQIAVTKADAVATAAAEELKIQQNLAASQIAQAELAKTLAELDLEKYLEGDYNVEFNTLQGSIALKQTELQEAKETVEFYRDLVKKGFRTPEALRAKEQAVEQVNYELTSNQERLDVLRKYTRKRQVAELTAKAEEAGRELDRAKSSSAALVAKAQSDLDVAEATARLEHQQLERLERQIELCVVVAPTHGTVVYSHGNKDPLDPGDTVNFKRKLFRITNLSQMQVKAFVHESDVKKVRRGTPAEIRVDAMPGLTLRGKVEDVADFYDGTRHWLSGGVKEYETIVAVDAVSEAGLKPGMTSQVKIHVGELSDCLVVPVPAVVEKDGRHYCYVISGQAVQCRPVTIGGSTESYVEITEGLTEGEKVALDARHRWQSELESGKGDGEAAREEATSVADAR
jgi:RND family efflux transporter MFP subunit